jgi:hypothetical protein
MAESLTLIPEGQALSDGASLTDHCCCVTLVPRDTIGQAMLLDMRSSTPPSLLERMLCMCKPIPRIASGIEEVPEISALAGATLQRGDHPTRGSVQTLKWAIFDKTKRVAIMEVFGGSRLNNQLGQWASAQGPEWEFKPVSSGCFTNCLRLCDWTYKFEFTEDWRHGALPSTSASGRPHRSCPKLTGLCASCLSASSRHQDHDQLLLLLLLAHPAVRARVVHGARQSHRLQHGASGGLVRRLALVPQLVGHGRTVQAILRTRRSAQARWRKRPLPRRPPKICAARALHL